MMYRDTEISKLLHEDAEGLNMKPDVAERVWEDIMQELDFITYDLNDSNEILKKLEAKKAMKIERRNTYLKAASFAVTIGVLATGAYMGLNASNDAFLAENGNVENILEMQIPTTDPSAIVNNIEFEELASIIGIDDANAIISVTTTDMETGKATIAGIISKYEMTLVTEEKSDDLLYTHRVYSLEAESKTLLIEEIESADQYTVLFEVDPVE